MNMPWVADQKSSPRRRVPSEIRKFYVQQLAGVVASWVCEAGYPRDVAPTTRAYWKCVAFEHRQKPHEL